MLHLLVSLIGGQQVEALTVVEFGQNRLGFERHTLFKLRVLDRAQQELAQTNLAFDYELVRGKNNSVEEIRFRFTPVTSEVFLPSLPATTEWQKALLEVGVSAVAWRSSGNLLSGGEIEVTYVQYVVQQQRTKSKQVKIKSPAGAVRGLGSRARI